MARDKVKLISKGLREDGEPTGTFYTTDKNKKTKPEKMSFKKYDKLAFNKATGKVGCHVEFVETKI